MNRLFASPLLALLLAPAIASAAQTNSPDLTIGDPAPPLRVAKWVQGGEHVSDFDTNHVYVVEFWATWCGPCRATIPHLNELANKFKDKGVIFIGQDVWDDDATVAPFVKQMGEKMTYRVALDDKSTDPDGFMSTHWWKRGVNHHGIPNAFIIDKARRIAWIGHPMGLTDAILNDVLSGHYDMEKAAAERRQELKDDEEMMALNKKLTEALHQEKWDAANEALDAMARIVAPERRADYGVETRLRILLGQKKQDDAYRLVDSYCTSHPKDHSTQNDLAWTILIGKDVAPHNLALAQKVATRVNQASGGTDATYLDTLARAQFIIGQTNEAVSTEQQAVKYAKDREKDELRKTLASYQAGQLPDEKP